MLVPLGSTRNTSRSSPPAIRFFQSCCSPLDSQNRRASLASRFVLRGSLTSQASLRYASSWTQMRTGNSNCSVLLTASIVVIVQLGLLVGFASVEAPNRSQTVPVVAAYPVRLFSYYMWRAFTTTCSRRYLQRYCSNSLR